MPLESGEKSPRPGWLSRLFGSSKPCVLRTVARNREGWILFLALALLAAALFASLWVGR